MNRTTLIRIAAASLVIIGLLFGVRMLILGGATPVSTQDKPVETAISQSIEAAAITSEDIEGAGTSFRVTKTTYSHDKSWVLVQIEPLKANSADPAFVILQKQPDGRFRTVMGPGTSFDGDELDKAKAPSELVLILASDAVIGEHSDGTTIQNSSDQEILHDHAH